jgi:uncharacterized membrane protein/protein-disulfide isomerase
MTKGTTRTLLLAFCLLGLGASAASAYVHYRLIADPTYTSFCDISETWNCESVYRSAYGTFAGVPVAVGGVLWFAFALLLLLTAESAAPQPALPASATRVKGKPAAPPPLVTQGSPVSGYLFVLSTIALAVVLYLGYASFFVLKTFCILCLITYVAVIGIFLVSGGAGAAPVQSLPGAAARDLQRLVRHPVALTLAILYVAGAASLIAFFPREDGPATASSTSAAAAALPPVQDEARQQFETWLAAQPRVPLTEPTDGAKVLIIKFNDYQCPPCRQTYNEYKPIVEKYQSQFPGQVKYVTKDFPLESECNNGGVHAASCEAAAAVRMARLKGKADPLEAWLFDNQPAMTPELVRRGAREVGGIPDFDAQYPKVLEQVRGDVALGRQLGVSSTPTFFVNGVKIVGGLRPQFFDAAIAYELKRGGPGAEKQ